MKIAPMAFNAKSNYISNKGQSAANMAYSNYQKLGEDVYARLAYASTRDSKIERELKTMDLII